ncbi:MAG: hypothetical protein V4864_15185 [Pseudomonadota bacterium]
MPKRLTALFLGTLSALPALAHPGHGVASEIHWHPSDTYGFVVVAVLAGVALWLSRGD